MALGVVLAAASPDAGESGQGDVSGGADDREAGEREVLHVRAV